jgi:DME family drug/metabolite transporter
MPEVDPKLFALTVALCFGLNPIMLKVGFGRGGSPDVGLMVGLIVAVPLYLLLLPLVGGLHMELVTGAAMVGYILGGLLGSGIGRRWQYIAIDKIGAAPASAIKNSAPVFTAILAAVFFQEKIALYQWAAIIGIVLGVVLISWKPGKPLRSWFDVGVLAAIAAAAAYGIRPLVLKFGLEAAELPLTAAIFGAIAALSYALLAGDRTGLRSIRGDPAFSMFVGAGILQSVGFLALNMGLAGGDVSVVYPVTSSAPLFTLVFSWLLLRGHEAVTWRIVVGVVAVVAGVVFL